MTEWTEGNIHVDDTAIHYHRTGGAGPPLLLLHGITDKGLCWTRVARDLADSYDVVMTDARGHGSSSRISDAFSIDTLANDAAAVIRALDLRRPAVFGHSMGAITAAVLAATHPDLVRAIVLEDPPIGDNLPVPTSDSQVWQSRWQALEVVRSLPRQERLVRAAADNPGWSEEEIVPWSDSKVEFDPAILQHAAMFRAVPWRDVLARIVCPVLLITGDPPCGAIVAPDVAEEASRLWQRGEVAHIPGAGHSIHRDRYDETMEEVRRFLASGAEAGIAS